MQNAEFKPAWLPEPIEIDTATAQFNGDTLTWANAAISVNGIEAKGSASYPLACVDPQGCPAQINLDFPALDLAALQSSILGAGRHGELLEAILSRVESPGPAWPALNGTIHAQTLTLNSWKLTNATASINVRDHSLNLLALDAATLGGATHATGSIEAASGGPDYALNLTWTGVKLAEAASLFPDKESSTAKWGAGTISGQTTLKLHGYSDLASTATGTFQWTLNGDWSATPLLGLPKKKSKPQPWQAAGTIANQTLILQQGPAQGTIAFDRTLDLTWTTPTAPIHLAGTIAHPAIAAKPAPTPATIHHSRGN